MSTDQEYWDACLIRTWRNGGTVIDAMSMFVSITGKRTDEATLLRVPKGSFPKSCQVFVANRLPKVSEWLFKNGAEHDCKLLKKLSQSNYDCTKTPAILPDPEKQRLYQEKHKAKVIKEYTTGLISRSNKDTDWNTVGGSIRRRAIR